MNGLTFIFTNWLEFLIVLALSLSIFLLIKELFRDMRIHEQVSQADSLLLNLVPSALLYVMDAEMLFGPGTGPIKRAWVINRLYVEFPNEFKHLITQTQLSEIVERTLDKLDELGVENIQIAKLLTPAT